MHGQDEGMRVEPDGLALRMGVLHIVVRYAAESVEEVLPLFEEHCPDDWRPRAAIKAAWIFAKGANRTKLQRITVSNAHRAAQHAITEAAKQAASAAGDAAAAAYLHRRMLGVEVRHRQGANGRAHFRPTAHGRRSSWRPAIQASVTSASSKLVSGQPPRLQTSSTVILLRQKGRAASPSW
jgi:hypothetical protein